MRKFIFYTSEGYTESPEGEMIESCQLLGDAEGATAKDAYDNLLSENPWIRKCGFDLKSGKVMARELSDDRQYLF